VYHGVVVVVNLLLFFDELTAAGLHFLYSQFSRVNP
jgi:hypothetical protein